MKQFLSVVGPVVGNFIAWALITKLPVHSLIIFALVITSGLLMVYLLIRLNFNKDPSNKVTMRR